MGVMVSVAPPASRRIGSSTSKGQRVHSKSPAGHGCTAVKDTSRSTKRCKRSQWRRLSAGGADGTGWGRFLGQHRVQAAVDNVGAHSARAQVAVIVAAGEATMVESPSLSPSLSSPSLSPSFEEAWQAASSKYLWTVEEEEQAPLGFWLVV